jgi:hypothetical protein
VDEVIGTHRVTQVPEAAMIPRYGLSA